MVGQVILDIESIQCSLFRKIKPTVEILRSKMVVLVAQWCSLN